MNFGVFGPFELPQDEYGIIPRALAPFQKEREENEQAGLALIVFPTPDFDLSPGIIQACKPVLIQAVIPKLPVEAFYKCVLDRLARRDEMELRTDFILPNGFHFVQPVRRREQAKSPPKTTIAPQCSKQKNEKLNATIVNDLPARVGRQCPEGKIYF